MEPTSTSTGMFLHFSPSKLPPPPVILGGPAPQNQVLSTPLPGSALYGIKRKRDGDKGPPPSKTFSFEEAIERAAQNELHYAAKQDGNGAVTKDRLKTFENRDELMTALGQCFKESQTVDFAGCYRAYDSNISHKQRIQLITHEIWKTTGYRFTIKDHPRAKDGHKTRLWCSQDEAHKNKPSKASHAPRITSDGLVLAKARYPCRSGLLISSRNDSEPNVSHVVIRMHHHLAHEPYYDHTLPPEMTQLIWENIPKTASMAQSSRSSLAPATIHPSPASTLTPIAPPGVFMEGGNFDSEPPPGASDPNNSLLRVAESSQGVMKNPSHQHQPQDKPIPHRNETYQTRMRKHIADIRDFCDGLEYQLQFDDVRLLEVLESEGSQFLKFVHHCLEMEGRLRNPTSNTPIP